ncbi:MAG: hypothetical protein HXS41_11120 [Theionarchaea archaeon]|nr:hypothetical protein [Theionarchaea archaeon]MBU7000554.1 hypothetical protein [Theionarchaea archaeon]MBU7021597.1 hypothetical protein [Theionarchaea archaeon]MBU7035710.1 hypothetical protein [Theionarchaea archaeon]MBU7041292.1 hypothetical protein [Theionarchaea archaeon]
MNIEEEIVDKVRQYAEEFIEREYPEEVPYLHLIWETFAEVLKERKNGNLEPKNVWWDLEGPSVRDAGGSSPRSGPRSVMAPKVVRAFYILLTGIAHTVNSESTENLQEGMLKLLSQNEFPLDFSMDIVDFFMDKRDFE